KDTSIEAVETPTRPLDVLQVEFLESKAKIAKLMLIHAEIEEQILRHVTPKESGTVTIKSPSMVTEVQFKLNYSFDAALLKAALPNDVFTAVTRPKYELDVRTYKKFMEMDQYNEVLGNLVSKTSAKPYIRVKNV